jgi:hypothetical protein
MKIKVKGTDKILTTNPNEWARIEKQGTANEYEIIERNTVWGVPLDDKGNVIRDKQEFEKKHWDNLMALGSKARWKRAEKDILKVKKSEIKSENIESDKLTLEPLKIADLQIELTQAQIDESKSQKKFIELQTVDLKRKYIYFIIGIILGNLGTVLLWIQWLSREVPPNNIP